jgi:hypothetical protein
MFKVVGRQALVARRQFRAALVGQLLRMQLDRQAVRLRGLEHALRLFRRKADALAEYIHRIGQPSAASGAIILQTSSM